MWVWIALAVVGCVALRAWQKALDVEQSTRQLWAEIQQHEKKHKALHREIWRAEDETRRVAGLPPKDREPPMTSEEIEKLYADARAAGIDIEAVMADGRP